MTARLLVSFLRDRDPAEAEALVPRLRRWHGLVIGVELDSAESGHPPELFERASALAADDGLHRVAHAEEEGPPAYVRSALDVPGVERVRPRHPQPRGPALVARLREERVPLTVGCSRRTASGPACWPRRTRRGNLAAVAAAA